LMCGPGKSAKMGIAKALFNYLKRALAPLTRDTRKGIKRV